MLNHFHGQTNKAPSSGKTPVGSMQGWGKNYDAIVGLLSLGQEQKLRQATIELAQIQPGERILEVGCGTGTLSLEAKKQAGSQGQVMGMDIAPDMIAVARQKAHKAGLTIGFEVGRIEEIPYPDQQFDLVLSSLMLHHIPSQEAKQQGLREIFRVLKPGGRVLIVDFAPPTQPLVRGLARWVVGPEMLAHRVQEFLPLVKQAGFTAIESGPTRSAWLEYMLGKKL